MQCVPRDTPEYKEGHEAYHNDAGEYDCPYEIGDPKRTGWYTGWFDARIQIKFKELFEKHGVTYP